MTQSRGFLIVNSCSALLGFGCLVAAINSISHPLHVCQYDLFYSPLLLVGATLFLASFAGLIVVFLCNSKTAMLVHSCLFLIVVIPLCILSTVVASKISTVEKVVNGYSYKGLEEQQRLGDYKEWLVNHLVTGKRWDKTRDCLADSNVCDSELKIEDLFTKSSSLQSGCCRPPLQCGFQYVNFTLWTNPASDGAMPDCTKWSNAQNRLCFDCDSCRAGAMATMVGEWKMKSLVSVISLYLLGLALFFLIIAIWGEPSPLDQ